MTGVLAELARLGPSFALDSHPAQSLAPLPWRPFQLPAAIEERVATVRTALAAASGRSADTVELRVAASVAQLGLAARLICPALGVAVLTGGVLDVDPARMRWQPGADGTVALSTQDDVLAAATAPEWAAGPAERDLAALADALAAGLLNRPVRALVEASRAFGVSEQVLWGNVASVVSGAVPLVGAAVPSLTGRAQLLASGLLDRPPLQGRHQGGDRGEFRRRSCCLVYRLTASPGPVCGDCVLNRAPGRASERA